MSILIIALAAVSAAPDAPRVIAELPRPPTIMVDAEDRFYLVEGGRVLRVGNDIEQRFQFGAPPGLAPVGYRVVVNRSGIVAALVSSRATKCDKNNNCSVTSHYAVTRCLPSGDCAMSAPAFQWKYSTKDGSGSRALGVGLSVDGKIGIGVERTRCSADNKCTTETIWQCDGKPCTAEAVRAMQESNLPTPPIARPDCRTKGSFDVGSFVMAADGRRVDIDASAQYVKRCGIDTKGRPHIVFHDPRSETLSHAWLSPSGKAEVEVLDAPESGIENAVAYLPDGRLVVFGYAYRNSFNKGLRATVVDPATEIDNSFWVDRSRDGNPGWGVVAAASSNGRILVAYKKDGRQGATKVLLYASLEAMLAHQVAEAEGWEALHRDFFVLGGVGALYPIWFARSLQPSTADDGVPGERIFDASYDLVSTPITSARLEARYGDLSFGITYLRSFINDQIEDAAGEVASEAFDWLIGSIGWDRLLFYHDVRLGVTLGRLRGRFTDDNGNADARLFDSNYQRYQLTLLNKYRFRYGLSYQTYDFHIPIYVYTAAANSRDYAFTESFTSDVKFHEGTFTLGYSRLDYAAKFENEVIDWFLDFDVGVGFSIADLQGAQTSTQEDIDTALALMLTFNVEIGVLLYRRFYSMYGLGLFARLGYKADGDFTGDSARPGPRDEDSIDSSDVSARYNRILIRHGPFIDLGIVF